MSIEIHEPISSSMLLRPATADDADILFDIRCSVKQNRQSREELAALGITPTSVSEMIEGGDYVTTIAEVNGRPVGFSMAQISEGYVFAAFVRPEFEGRGIGRAIMKAAEDGLRRAGVAEAWLSTGAEPELRAGGFYRHLGWHESGNLEDGQIIFKKQLFRPNEAADRLNVDVEADGEGDGDGDVDVDVDGDVD